MSAQAEQIAKQFGLEPIPESVARLTRLVATQDADLDVLAKIIMQDKGLTARLLRAANPDAANEKQYEITSVDEAIMRGGLGPVFILAMGDPVQRAVLKTFTTMLTTKLESVHPGQVPPIQGEHMLAEVGFAGKAVGQVDLRVTPQAARVIAARLLGVPPQQMTDPGEINDVLGEVINIVAGNFKSNLSDAGLDCKLAAPKLMTTSTFEVQTPRGWLRERMAYRGPELSLFMDLTVNPWSA